MRKETKLTILIYKLEAFGFKILEKTFILLGIRLSGFIFGTLFMIFGPLTRPSFLAMRNIKKAMPQLTFIERFKIVIGMWNNLGRNLTEFVNINNLTFEEFLNYVSIDDESSKILKKLEKSKNGALIFTAHFGNWELFSQLLVGYDIPLTALYREMNNKFVDAFVLKIRTREKSNLIPKGTRGVIRLARGLKEGKKILMLVDQRLSTGITVPFFNIPSKTTDSIATFALKYNYQVCSAVVFRKSFGCSFDIKIREFEVINTGNLEEDIKNTTIKINETMEGWIKQKPEQWFWVHNRWK